MERNHTECTQIAPDVPWRLNWIVQLESAYPRSRLARRLPILSHVSGALPDLGDAGVARRDGNLAPGQNSGVCLALLTNGARNSNDSSKSGASRCGSLRFLESSKLLQGKHRIELELAENPKGVVCCATGRL